MMKSARILSTPIRVVMMGFESDTLRLQNAGWELSVYEDFSCHAIRLAMRHRTLRLYALSRLVRLEHYYDLANRMESIRHLVFDIQGVAPEIQTIVEHRVDFSKFKPIDAVPQWVDQEIKQISDFNIFRTLEASKEIIVDPKTVSEMLNEILKSQAPKQKELREELRKKRRREEIEFLPLENIKPAEEVHAQIITIAA